MQETGLSYIYKPNFPSALLLVDSILLSHGLVYLGGVRKGERVVVEVVVVVALIARLLAGAGESVQYLCVGKKSKSSRIDLG